jgi:hypothetical protein
VWELKNNSSNLFFAVISSTTDQTILFHHSPNMPKNNANKKARVSPGAQKRTKPTASQSRLLNEGASVNKVSKRESTTQNETPESTTTPATTCPICARLPSPLHCCLSISETASSCPTCTQISTSFIPTSNLKEDTRQLKQDRIASLKLSTKDMEAEAARLKQILDDKKRDLMEKKKELMGKMPRNEFARRWRDVKRKGGAGGSKWEGC